MTNQDDLLRANALVNAFDAAIMGLVYGKKGATESETLAAYATARLALINAIAGKG